MRPTEPEFRELCRSHTRREIAEQYGVTQPAVDLWSKRYGCKPKKAVVGPDWRRGPHVNRWQNHVRFRGWQG